ncbi:unnamed protein product, partial [Heterobilharzia americana]
DTVAKKPYNPIIGETFHCSWIISPHQLNSGSCLPETNRDNSKLLSNNNKPIVIRYCAEQVSHHPPICFPFLLSCKENGIDCINIH